MGLRSEFVRIFVLRTTILLTNSVGTLPIIIVRTGIEKESLVRAILIVIQSVPQGVSNRSEVWIIPFWFRTYTITPGDLVKDDDDDRCCDPDGATEVRTISIRHQNS